MTTTTMKAEHAATALDPILAALETMPCPVLSGAAEAARDALLRLLDVLVMAEPGTSPRTVAAD